jgi:hypothetical protein
MNADVRGSKFALAARLLNYQFSPTSFFRSRAMTAVPAMTAISQISAILKISAS